MSWPNWSALSISKLNAEADVLRPTAIVPGNAAPDTPLSKDILSSLSTFNARNKFKKNALMQVANKVSASEVAALRDAFNKIDKDHSGALCARRGCFLASVLLVAYPTRAPPPSLLQFFLPTF